MNATFSLVNSRRLSDEPNPRVKLNAPKISQPLITRFIVPGKKGKVILQLPLVALEVILHPYEFSTWLHCVVFKKNLTDILNQVVSYTLW